MNVDELLTRAGWVEQRLRTAITTGELLPGQRISVPELAREWNVSATPFREVLSRLAAEGLVKLTPQRGVSVTLISEADLRDLYTARQLIEPRAVRAAVEVRDEGYTTRLRAVWQPLETQYSAKLIDRVAAEQAHQNFHLALVDAGESGWFHRISKMLSDHSMRYRILGTSMDGFHKSMIDEHRRLLDACLAGNGALAEELLTNHFRITVDKVVSALFSELPERADG